MTDQQLLSGKERFLIPDGLLRDPTAVGRAGFRIGAKRSQITKAPRHKIIVDASISRRVPALIQCRVGKPPAPDPKPQSGVPGRRTGDLCRINCGSMLALPTTTVTSWRVPPSIIPQVTMLLPCSSTRPTTMPTSLYSTLMRCCRNARMSSVIIFCTLTNPREATRIVLTITINTTS